MSSKLILETRLPDGTIWSSSYRLENGYIVRFADLADFRISDNGEEITIVPVPGVSTQTVEHLYQNQALPLALSLQNKLVLHGSAVEVGNGAVAFLAESGRGKSTIAASFSSNGYRFLTDDALMLDKKGDKYWVDPSHPSIRLWDDSCEAITLTSTVKTPPIDYSTKIRFLADDNLVFCENSRILERIYFLGEGTSKDISIEPVSSQKAVIWMKKNNFLLALDERRMLTQNFLQLTDLARSSLFYSLDYPRNYEILPDVRAAILQHSQLDSAERAVI